MYSNNVRHTWFTNEVIYIYMYIAFEEIRNDKQGVLRDYTKQIEYNEFYMFQLFGVR